MIDSIQGTVQFRESSQVVIACGGIGYACQVSLRTAAAVGATGAECTLYTRLLVRENELSLYGFLSRGERSCFDQLIGISSVGPKAALAILSEMTPDAFALAVAAGDAKALTRCKGIGTKIAQRIVLELKDKLAKDAKLEGTVSVPILAGNSNIEEAMSALMVLGYGQSEAAGVLQQFDPNVPSSELIRLSLMRLGKQMLG